MYLNCKTYFSFRYGTFKTEELVQAAADLGITALALTNINNCSDAWDFYTSCKKHEIKPILGAEIRNGDAFCYVLLAASVQGFEHINTFLSDHLLTGKPFPPDAGSSPLLGSGSDVYIIYRPGDKKPENLCSNEFVGVSPYHITKLFGFPITQLQHKLVILHPVSFQNRKYFNAHRLLRAIDNNTLLSMLKAEQHGSMDELFISPSALMAAFISYPFIITNTISLVDACHLEMEMHTDKNKKTFSASIEDDRLLLSKLAYNGCAARYGIHNQKALKRVKKELQIIDEMGFNTYFLITWDVIRYAQGRGYFYVGRGSGANSIVAYCLQITDVDPLELDLYFERFLNPHRSSPPDFDIDFSWVDRDDVIDYIFKRYGKRQVALLGMITTFQYNAIVRELGKVFGLPKAEIDQLSVKGYYSHASAFDEKQAGDRIQQLILTYGKLLVNFPNHLSIHPGGMLISELPMYRYTAIYMPPKGFPTTQIDMFVAEKVGLFKLDILSQRGLGHIKETLQLVKKNQNKNIQIHEIENFKKDVRVREQIKRVDTIGCFYIESPAMRQLLKKLECDDYITLVAASSIIRPGVSSSGMMKAYIERYHDPASIKYVHPVMKELLEETFGVMVYQEDVIKVAHHFAGLDMGEADILRRAMSGKYRGNEEMIRIRGKFFENCREKGIEETITKEVWRQIESFGGYSFSKAHSASFAVESYQSLYLKTYYPKEFMVAVINNFGGFYSRELYFYELEKMGACIHAPCINNSEWLTNIKGEDVYVGFIHLKSLEQAEIENLIVERNKYGVFYDLQDLLERTGIGKETLNTLIRINALRFTGKSKKQLLWEANLQHSKKHKTGREVALFHHPIQDYRLPDLPEYPLEELYDQLELMGFPLHNPFPLVDDDPSLFVKASEMGGHKNQTVKMLGYLITTKPVKTVKGELMCFGTFIDSMLDWIDTVHFPDSLKRYPLAGTGFYQLTGVVVEEFGVFTLEVQYLNKSGLKKRKPDVIKQ